MDDATSAYDEFLAASDFAPSLKSFEKLCSILKINRKDNKTIFSSLKSKLKSYKSKTLFQKLEKKAKHKDYDQKPCSKLKVLVIGAGPVGLRTAIEAALLGACVVVVEKRGHFNRNNVLHLWPYLIVDLKSLGVKSFFGKFGTGSLDHIAIKRLQCVLLKVCLLLGVQVHANTTMEDVIEPNDGKGWRVDVQPKSSPLNTEEFNVIVGCDGSNNALKFKRNKGANDKLALAITCNFVNKQTTEEMQIEEISGVLFLYNQDFFHGLTEKTGIELENIVYYKDETHYFVMTAKKSSLLSKGVLKQNSKDVEKLLSHENINREKLSDFAQECADYATKYQLPHHEFAVNHRLERDVSLFQFTSLYHAENASKIIERKGKRLLLCIAGDVLVEPFWPKGTGVANGFLSAMDAAWMIRRFGLRHHPIDIIQERESILTLLNQTTPDSLIQKFGKYSIDPTTRYPNLNTHILTKEQAKVFYDCTNVPVDLREICNKGESTVTSKPIKVMERKETINCDNLLTWCRRQTIDFANVNVINFTSSWKNGLAFCALISRCYPELIDFSSLDPNDIEWNCKKAFSVAEKYLGIPPIISSRDFTAQSTPDRLVVIAYLSLYYEALKDTVDYPRQLKLDRSINEVRNSNMQNLSTDSSGCKEKKKRERKEVKENEKREFKEDNERSLMIVEEEVVNCTKEIVLNSSMIVGQGESEHCYFCHRKMSFMNRSSAEGIFFHRKCLRCSLCKCHLLLSNYVLITNVDDQQYNNKFFCRMHYNRIIRETEMKAELEGKKVTNSVFFRAGINPTTQFDEVDGPDFNYLRRTGIITKSLEDNNHRYNSFDFDSFGDTSSSEDEDDDDDDDDDDDEKEEEKDYHDVVHKPIRCNLSIQSDEKVKHLEKKKEAKKKAKEIILVRKEMKAREMRRLRRAQSIQRQLCEAEVTQREIEERAEHVEQCIHDNQLSTEQMTSLTNEWISLVTEKNTLQRLGADLLIAADTLRLEDRQARIEEQIRDLLQYTDTNERCLWEIKRLTKEHKDTVGEKNELIESLEDDCIKTELVIQELIHQLNNF